MKKKEDNLLYADIPIDEALESLKGFKKSIFPSKREKLKKMKKDLLEMKDEIKIKKELERVREEKRRLTKPSLFSVMFDKVKRR